jgi:uracil-DNA glycosylase
MFTLPTAEWRTALANEWDKAYMEELSHRVQHAYASSVVYPPQPLVLEAFRLCNLPDVKVVILGQDPYHGPGQANGLAFSVNDGVRLPPSLLNIFKEIKNVYGYSLPITGNLERWAKQGVFLLNTVLTVEKGLPGSHAKWGWQTFTEAVIRTISERQEHVVFILWGAYAQKKAECIDASKHLILQSAHPSPLSAYQGFFGNGHFEKANAFLIEKGKTAVVWE